MKRAAAELLSRTFSTRAPTRKTRSRLRAHTQRRLGLGLSLALLYVVLCLLQPALNRLTVSSSAFWLASLELEARAGLQALEWAGWQVNLPVIHTNTTADAPGLLWHVLLLGALLVVARRLFHRRPSAAWALCGMLAVHGLSVLAAATGAGTPLGLAAHTLALSACMQLLLLCAPLVLVFGFFVLEPSWPRRLLASGLLLSYLMMSGALKLVSHAWLAELGGPVMLPTLFILFGPAFDVLALAGILSSLLAMPPQLPAARSVADSH